MEKANNILTYIRQLHLQELDLERDDLLREIDAFPDHLEIEHCRLDEEPPGWDRAKFGDWIPVTFIKGSMQIGRAHV